MKILVCNAGSTSLKFKLLSMPEGKVLSKGAIERIGSNESAYRFSGLDTAAVQGTQSVPDYTGGILLYLDYLGGAGSADAVAFKTVLAYGYTGVHLIDDKLLSAMTEALDVAPAHNSAYIAAIKAFMKAAPGKPLIGCFETEFHKDMPEEHMLYSVPYEWYEKYGIRRMGYHGASHAGAAKLLKPYARAISCHLGGSGSICAMRYGASVDNSFGMSLQAGLPHVNRCGDIDAYIIKRLLNKGLSLDEIFDSLEKDSGLKGISGLSGDMRDLRQAAASGDHRAELAIKMYVTQALRIIGGYAAELGGVDAISFTGGIGENDALTRSEICAPLAFMGIRLDENKNLNSESRIEAEGSVPVYVIKADEELNVAGRAYDFLFKNR